MLGKIVGGGLPVGAYGGRADIMSKVMPAGPVFQAGTLSGNPLAMAAGLATLRELKANPPYASLEQLGQILGDGLQEAAPAPGIPHRFAGSAACGRCSSRPEPVTDYDSPRNATPSVSPGFSGR